MYAGVVGRVAPRFVTAGAQIIHAFSEGLGVLRSPRRFICRVFLGARPLARERARVLDRRSRRSASTCRSAPRTSFRASSPSASRCHRHPDSSACSRRRPKVGLEVYGVSGGQAVSWAIGFHILSFIPITVIGLYYFARLGLHFSDFKTPA